MKIQRAAATVCLAVLATLSGASLPLGAQQAVGARPDSARSRTVPPVFGDAERDAVMGAVLAEVERTYVDADTARQIAALLDRRWKSGAYAALRNPSEFGEEVTRDLRAVNHDLHLSLQYQPPTPGSAATSGIPQDAARQNFGIGKAEILEGNVGYLEINAFAEALGYRDAVVAALQFLARTDALIIDVRRNGGGGSGMSHFVFSHFLPASADPTIVVKSRRAAEPTVRRSLAEVPGPRRTEVPLFLLTSQGTGSAAEEFSFVLKNKGRAQLIGSRTAGAGHMVTFVPVGNNFVLGLSITRVSDATTGKEWEQTGVIPDVPVAPAQAFDEAYVRALKVVLQQANGDAGRERPLGRLLKMAEARRSASPISKANWPQYTGVYAGREITLVDGQLMYTRRTGGMSEILVPLAANRFALGAVEFEFTSEKGVRRLTIGQPNGTSVTLDRSPPK